MMASNRSQDGLQCALRLSIFILKRMAITNDRFRISINSLKVSVLHVGRPSLLPCSSFPLPLPFLFLFLSFPPSLSPSLPPSLPLQGGCSSGTRIRSTQPSGWPSSSTTPAPTPRKPPSTWCLMWTTSRQPTASLSPTPVSPRYHLSSLSVFRCVSPSYLSRFLLCFAGIWQVIFFSSH